MAYRKLEKPDSCVVCYEKTTLDCFECGHWLHSECLKKQTKAECPLCRKPLSVRLNKRSREETEEELLFFRTRTNHSAWRIIVDIDPPFGRERSEPDVVGDVIERGYESDNSVSNWREQGYAHKEEHPDYDSQNPGGDDVDYPDMDYPTSDYEL